MADKFSSFQKKAKGKILQIPGTKASLHNNQLLISTGVPSLDLVLGGGMAVGTLLLIEEDTYSSYSKLLLKYYLSEGAVCQQHLLLCSADIQPIQIIQELPAPLVDDPGSQVTSDTQQSTDSMKIAWRYQHLPQVQSNPGGSSARFGHYYDLTKTMDSSTLKNVKKTLVDVAEEVTSDNTVSDSGESDSCFMDPAYVRALQSVHSAVQQQQFTTSTKGTDKNILRIAVHSLGSPQWSSGQTDHHTDHSLCRFLYAMRSILRTSFATCLVTVPTHLFEDSCLQHRVEHLSDTVLRLEAFVGSDLEQNQAYKEYHGLFHVVKLPRLNSLTHHTCDTKDLAFKLRRKKFMIEKLHLPPDLSDTASRSQEEVIKPPAGAAPCGSGGNKKLDF